MEFLNEFRQSPLRVGHDHVVVVGLDADGVQQDAAGLCGAGHAVLHDLVDHLAGHQQEQAHQRGLRHQISAARNAHTGLGHAGGIGQSRRQLPTRPKNLPSERPAQNASTLSYWKWRLGAEQRGGGAGPSATPVPKSGASRRRPKSRSKKPTFVEVAAPTAAAEPLDLIMPGELRVRVPVGFDEDTLAAV
ncbi:MAG: hypothetical protein PVI30_27235, partial [Myxococcales bacterium]